jgi:hypothetical protein
MRMPILAYFTIIGITLFLLLNASSYALPDVGPPIKTSQLVGLPKVEPRPGTEPPLMFTFNFGAPVAKESVDTILPDTVYAKVRGTFTPQKVHLAKQRRPTKKDHPRASSERRFAAAYSHDVMMAIH